MIQQFHSLVYSQKKWEHMPIQKLSSDVHCSIIRNNWNVEITQMSLNWWTDK